VQQGLISGPELYAIENPGAVELWGVEEKELYIENLMVYRDSLADKEKIEKDMKSLSHIMQNLKRHIYSEELLEIDQQYVQFKENSLKLKDYIVFLTKKARQKAVAIKSFSNLYMLHQALGQEEHIDFRLANRQRNEVINRLEKVLSSNELEDLVRNTVEFKAERISPYDFYTFLVRKAQSIDLDLKDYPELQKYIVYISLYQAIDKSRISQEMTVLEENIKETVFRNDVERKLNALSKEYALTKSIFNATLTRDDYAYYLSPGELWGVEEKELYI